MLALCVALAASPHSAECAFVRPLSLTARVSARPKLLHPTVPPRRALLIAMQAKAPRAAPSFLELLKFTVFAMPIYRTPIHLFPMYLSMSLARRQAPLPTAARGECRPCASGRFRAT